jgi:hypothetical protein
MGYSKKSKSVKKGRYRKKSKSVKRSGRVSEKSKKDIKDAQAKAAAAKEAAQADYEQREREQQTEEWEKEDAPKQTGGRTRPKSKSVKRGGYKPKSKAVKIGGRTRTKSKSVKRGGSKKPRWKQEGEYWKRIPPTDNQSSPPSKIVSFARKCVGKFCNAVGKKPHGSNSAGVDPKVTEHYYNTAVSVPKNDRTSFIPLRNDPNEFVVLGGLSTEEHAEEFAASNKDYTQNDADFKNFLYTHDWDAPPPDEWSQTKKDLFERNKRTIPDNRPGT